jgi:uncharacterized membrane protein
MSELNTWLVFLHVLGAMVWLGAWSAIAVFAWHIVRQPDLASIRRLFATMKLLGPAVFGPATLLVLGAGIWLVARYDRVSFTDPWILIGLALYVLATLVGMLGMSRANRKADAAAQQEDLESAVAATRRWLSMALAVDVILVLATADMIFA